MFFSILLPSFLRLISLLGVVVAVGVVHFCHLIILSGDHLLLRPPAHSPHQGRDRGQRQTQGATKGLQGEAKEPEGGGARRHGLQEG